MEPFRPPKPALTLPLANFPAAVWERGQASFYCKLWGGDDDTHIHVAGSINDNNETIGVISVSIKYLGNNENLRPPIRNIFLLFGELPEEHPPEPLRAFYITALRNAGLIP
jgi:hypothetical protein